MTWLQSAGLFVFEFESADGRAQSTKQLKTILLLFISLDCISTPGFEKLATVLTFRSLTGSLFFKREFLQRACNEQKASTEVWESKDTSEVRKIWKNNL
jgi:hypothetical protein